MATEEKYSTTILSVDHAKIGIVRTSQITSKAVKTIKIKFEFRSTEWQSMTKTAVFIKEENDYLCSTGDQVVKHVSLDQSNECFIPTEVIQDQGCFSVGVYGTYGNEMLPTNLVKLKYHMGCYFDGTAPSAPTQSVYEQIMTALSLKATKSELNDYAKKNEIGQYIPDTYATKEYVNTYGGKIDKIQVNGTEQSITNKTVNISVPTKVSQLNNDSGYLTSFIETDPTVPSWAKQATKPTYTATEVGALPNDTVIPTKTSDLTNDSGFLIEHQSLSAYRTSADQDTIDASKISISTKGVPGGVAELDSNGKVPSSQLPSYVDDVLEYAVASDFPAAGETGKIYVAKDTNITYRWGSTEYVEISPSLALGDTSSTAYRGDRGKIAYDHSQLTSGNPHNVSKSDVGLGNVDNTSDATKKTNFTGSIAANNTGFVTGGDVKTALDAKSTVSVSATGTATDEIQYITVNGVEKKLAGGDIPDILDLFGETGVAESLADDDGALFTDDADKIFIL